LRLHDVRSERSWPRPHARRDKVSRADNLEDVLAAYDALAGWPGVDRSAIAMVGTSYGGYLATIATALRPVRSIALRVPALYPDAQWETPKSALDRRTLDDYRSVRQAPVSNCALQACQAFECDALVLASGNDEILPPASVHCFTDAFVTARSVTQYTIAAADHALTDSTSQMQYAALLLRWIKTHVTPTGQGDAPGPRRSSRPACSATTWHEQCLRRRSFITGRR